MTDFTLTKDADGVAFITWDAQGKSMNVMTREAFELVSALVDQALEDDEVKGVVITSGKEGSFAGGMDLSTLATIREEAGDEPAQALFDFVMGGHHILRKLELAGMDPKTKKGGKPVVCAINGTCAGIGTEIALACHHRVMTSNPKAKIGLPEILLGIFPGGGGTTRFSRMVGAMAAAPVLLEGKMMDPAKAKGAQLIDAVSDDPVAAAKEWVLNAKDADLVKPWDAKGYKMPGGAPYHPAGFMTFVGANAMVNGKTQGAFPAAKALLSSIYEGALVDFDTALRIEARWFTSILMNPSSSAMIRSLFLNKEALEKGAVRPKDVPDQRVKKVGVLGAGMMGAGIALVSAQAGMEVVLVDRDQEAADKGKAYTESYLDKGIKRGKVTAEKKEAMLDRITATPDLDHLKGLRSDHRSGLRRPRRQSRNDPKGRGDYPRGLHLCLEHFDPYRSPIWPRHPRGLNSSSASTSSHPLKRCSWSKSSRAKETGDRAVAKALDYVRQIRKTPIVVNDARFFYANRCIIPYINEGVRMIAEGVNPVLIDNAARQLGFPVGPIQLTDETSIDLGAKIARATKAAMGDAYPESPSDDLIFWMEEQGRLGRKANAGFFDYDDKGKRVEYWKGLQDKYPHAEDQPDLIEVQERLMFAQVLEAVRALEEGVLEDIREGDVGAILGWGFAPWSGGPLSWLDIIGTPYAAERCDQLTEAYGERFACPPLLREMAEKGQSFYGRFNPEAKAA